MKTLYCTLALTLTALSTFGQGSVLYQNTAGVTKEKYIYGIDLANPLSDQLGGTRAKCEGTGSFAQLFWGLSGAAEADLTAVDGSMVSFRTGTTAGLINGISKLPIQGILGGTRVTLQIRCWDNQGGTVTSWAQVLQNDTVARGKSLLVTNYELSGVDVDNAPHVGTGNLASAGLQSFGMFVVPEPSVIALGAIGLGALVLRRRK